MAFGGVASPGRFALGLKLRQLTGHNCSFRCGSCSSLLPRVSSFWPRTKTAIGVERRLSLEAYPLAETSAGQEEKLTRSLSKKRLARLRSIVAAASTKGTDAVVAPSPLDVFRLKVLENEKPVVIRQRTKDARSPSSLSSSSSKAEPRTSFKALKLSDELLAAVDEMKLGEPTEIQELGIPAILDGEDVILASHTGSGKTLAYLLPLVQKLREDEEKTGKMARPRRPRAVVLGPTRELTEQVLQVAKSLSHHARFRSAMISGGCRPKPQEEVLSSSLDMVVGTPGRLLMHVENGHMSYGDIKYVVLDEADTMFDRGFGPEVRKFLGPLRKRGSAAGAEDSSFQCVLVTATLTKSVQRLLDEEFPGMTHIHTSSLHKRVVGSRHDFLPVSGEENKLEVLAQVLTPAISKGQRLMVFCNTLSSCRAAEHFLRENGILSVCYHGEVSAEERVVNLDRFRGISSGKHSDDRWEESVGTQRSSIPVLVCTDLAARGLDLIVDHVVMFDFPRNPIDYLHRTGRTARMGAKGKITSLVTKRDQLLAGEIEASIRQGTSMEALTSDKTKILAMKKREVEEQRKAKAKADWKGNRRPTTRYPGPGSAAKGPVAEGGAKLSKVGTGGRRGVNGSAEASKNKPSFQIPKGTKGDARRALQLGEVPGKRWVKDTTKRRRP